MKAIRRIEKEAFFEILIFFVVMFTIAFLWQNNSVLFIVALIECFVVMNLWHEKYDVIYFIVAAALGPIGEIICIHYGTWSYTKPSLFGIPIWLPLVWGLAGILITRIARTIVRAFKK